MRSSPRFAGCAARRGIPSDRMAATKRAYNPLREPMERAMSDLNLQVKLRRIEQAQIFDRRLAIAALVIAILIGGLGAWALRMQTALGRSAEVRQGWSELMLRADDEQMGKAKRTLRAFVEQVKRMPDALRERNGMDAFVTRASTRCLGLYGYATTTLIAGSTDDCPPKSAKPEDKEKYYADLDVSRQLVKGFHEKLMLLDQEEMISDPVRRRFIGEGTVDFLTNIWLPVEKGLNHVVEKDAEAKDKNAQRVRDWYAEQAEKIKHAARSAVLLPETSYY